MGSYRFIAPVVEDGRLVGTLWPQDVIESYNAEILKRDMASTMAVTVGNGTPARALPGVRGMSMAEVPAPASFFGRSLGSLDIRKPLWGQPAPDQTEAARTMKRSSTNCPMRLRSSRKAM